MSYTREQWARALLQELGNSNPDPGTVSWLIGWTDWETSEPPGAAYNLLNTTQDEPGASAFNHFGSQGQYSVKNYQNFQQGIDANITALKNGDYPALEQALAGNDLATLENSQAVNGEIATWGTGKSGAQIESLAGQQANQPFPGSMLSFNPFEPNSNLPQVAPTSTTPPANCPGALSALGLCALAQPETWLRLGVGAIGILAIGIGAWSLTKGVAQP